MGSNVKLTGFEVRWAESIGRALIPRGAAGGTCDAVQVGPALDREVRASTWYIAVLLRFGLWVSWLCPPFVLGAWRSFGGLSEADRALALERLLGSKVYAVRMAINFLKISLCGLILGEPAFLQRLDAYGLGAPQRVAPAVEVEPARRSS